MKIKVQPLIRAKNKKLKDVIAPGLRVLFCGINPGLYSAAVGHNFARPGNRFWRALFGSGFTGRLFVPQEERELLKLGFGITNIVSRATSTAGELSREELVRGAQVVTRKTLKFQPQFLAVVGVSAYRTAFRKPTARPGLQEDTIGITRIWVLPNPSGLNAHYQLPELIRHFKELHDFAFPRNGREMQV